MTNETNNQDDLIQIRVKRDDKNKWKTRAMAHGLSLSEFIRRIVNDYSPKLKRYKKKGPPS